MRLHVHVDLPRRPKPSTGRRHSLTLNQERHYHILLHRTGRQLSAYQLNELTMARQETVVVKKLVASVEATGLAGHVAAFSEHGVVVAGAVVGVEFEWEDLEVGGFGEGDGKGRGDWILAVW